MTNSEIQKYIWKDFSKHKLLIVPAVSFIIFFSLLNIWYNKLDVPATFTSFFIFAIIFIYASYAVMNSIFEEVNDGTWDYQRLSPVSPCCLAFGKLIGSTLFAYYISIFAIAAHYYFLVRVSQDYIDILLSLFITLLCGIFCNALSLFLATLTLQEKQRNKKIASSISYAVCLFFSTSIYLLSERAKGLVTWYNIDFEQQTFFILTVTSFLLWSLFGSYRILKQNLMYRVTPFAWLSFVIFVIFYFLGFQVSSKYTNHKVKGSGHFHKPLVIKSNSFL